MSGGLASPPTRLYDLVEFPNFLYITVSNKLTQNRENERIPHLRHRFQVYGQDEAYN